MSNSERFVGTVKWFDGTKGYGFIEYKEGKDLFVHYSAISTDGYKTLEERQKDEFSIVESQRGPQASDVSVA